MKSMSRYPFAHHKLEVYTIALRIAEQAKAVAHKIPRGYRNYADHLLRSSGNTMMLIGEGANSYSSGMKRQRYEEALGEAGEGEPPPPARAAERAEDRRTVVAEVVCTLGLVHWQEVEELMELASRVCAMLTRLVLRHRR